ncbi:MAG: exonuclease domain-containing protein [Pirellulales bacterium]
MSTGILLQRILDTPLAIIDFETTGFNARSDRVVEVAVVRVDPGEQPRLVLDTLVNPGRRVTATEIHRISDRDVQRAPRFGDIAGELLAVTSGCVIGAFNVYFDIKFLTAEMSRVGVEHSPPHLCVRYLRPMLQLGSDCRLNEACACHQVSYVNAHMASSDAMAAARLFIVYREEIVRRGISTYAELGRIRAYKFCQSFSSMPYPEPIVFSLPRCREVRSRTGIRTRTASSTLVTGQEPRLPVRTNARQVGLALNSVWKALVAAAEDAKAKFEKWSR